MFLSFDLLFITALYFCSTALNAGSNVQALNIGPHNYICIFCNFCEHIICYL